MSESPNKKLSDFVRKQMTAQNIGYRGVALRSGKTISHGTVFDVVNERTSHPTTTTLKGLAKGLGVPEEEIFAIALGSSPLNQKIEEELLRYLHVLSPMRQMDLLKMAKLYYLEAIPADASTSDPVNLPESERMVNENIKKVSVKTISRRGQTVDTPQIQQKKRAK